MPWKLITLREADLNGQCLEEPLSLLLAEGKILRGREGNNLLVHACRTNSLFFLFLFLSLFPFFLLSFLSFLFPCFLFCDPSQVVVTVVLSFFFLVIPPFSPSPLRTTRASFYSAYRGQILLFQPLTTFVWSGCTCQPPLDRLCVTPHHQTNRTILFVSLSCYGVVSLSLSFMACTQWLQLSFARLDGVSSQQDTSPKKALVRTSKQVFPSPHHQTIPAYI